MPESDPDSVIPAQLSFLAIYNPSLGPTDETIEDQIVFYTSRSENLQRLEGLSNEEDGIKSSENGKNERLRQIGLAQGMVNFASNFSSGKTLEYVETEKTRVVLLELEKDWWLVASIDLTRLPAESTQPSSNDAVNSSAFQYSSREMGHPHLLIQQLRRAHSIFLLLHDFSLSDLYERAGRPSLCLFLQRFWERFAWGWELLLTGNPIVDVYNGIKLAAGGELGIGVGEEEWGSGEREVLEDFVTRTDGLVDLVVSRFGDSAGHSDFPSESESNGDSRWLALDTDPRPADGIIFSGVNAISRRSVARVSHWMEWIYRYGDATYGVGRDPNSLRRRKPRRHRETMPSGSKNASARSASEQPAVLERAHTPGIPRPLVVATPQPTPGTQGEDITDQNGALSSSDPSAFGTETVMKFLTLGYGTAWNLSSLSPPSLTSSPAAAGISKSSTDIPAQTGQPGNDTPRLSPNEHNGTRSGLKKAIPGRFVLGPRDDLDTLDELEETSPGPESDVKNTKTRIVHRTLHFQLADHPNASGNLRKLQAVVYVNQPFIFTFLFETDTASLSSPSLYSSIHHQLGPLQKPLLSSTSPATADARINMTDPTGPNKNPRTQAVHDLVYDPSNLTIRSSIPNIPSITSSSQSPGAHIAPNTPSSSPTRPQSPNWSRIESLSIHHRLLTTYIDTRSRPQELERTSKTTRGWWILWVRIPQSTTYPPPPALSSATSSTALFSLAEGDEAQETHENETTFSSSISTPESPPAPQEAFLVRKASDYLSPASHGRMSSGARFFRDLGGASSKLSASKTDSMPSKLVEGIGLDARRYVEGLLRFNR
ncbi:hypothetical protein N7488_001124 [Penicillium malachiteum]|nr:hypothetical protein N7488_001124 [Penicillium malachiteum]